MGRKVELNDDSAADADAREVGDDALMTAYASGDTKSFETLYARHRATLYRFVRRILGPQNHAATDEVYQDTWLRVVHARERWAPQGASFRTWLFTMAQNRAIDILRRSGREVSMYSSDDDAPPYEPTGSPWQQWPQADEAPGQEDALFWRRAGTKLLDCLAELPLAQKAVFLMHHEDGDTLEAIAGHQGLGFETVKSRLRYAMSKLRTCMGAHLDPLRDFSVGAQR
jgi:RNA polymerase sigma factor (sigma-70 family)